MSSYPFGGTGGKPGGTDAGAAWADRAEPLADWARERLVNRTDAWIQYRPEEEVGREYTKDDGTTGTLGEQRTVRGTLTRARLVQHFRPRRRSDIIVLHTASADNTSKGGGPDIDCHGEGSTDPTTNRTAAIAWYDKLRSQGFTPLLYESNGRGGYHLRILLAEAIPAGRLFWFLKLLTANYAELGFPKRPEHFPKQADVRNCTKGCGSGLRVPGRHHKRPFWSRVWDGTDWLDGHDAIDFMLALKGDPGALVPWDAEWQVRVGAYLAKLPTGLGEGQGRDDVAFNFLAFMVRDLKLDDPYALEWAGKWDAGNTPPKGPERLREILANVHGYGQREYGSGLGNGTAPPPDEAAAPPPAEPPPAEPPPGSVPDWAADVNLTDVGNGRRVIREHGHDLHYVYAWKSWLTWAGGRWQADEKGEAVRRVKRTQAALRRRTVREMKALTGAKDAAAKKRFKELKDILEHCLAWEDSRRTAASLDMARSEPGVAVVPGELDTDPFLLNVANGTLDLKTGRLREHRREDLLTKLAPVEYDPGAACPLWDQFILWAMGGKAGLVGYLRRVVGYCLSGDVSEQCLWFLHGHGSNGKTTFVRTLLSLLGDYGYQAVPELLLQRQHESHPTERADLFGRRLVETIEVDEGRRIAEALLKLLTGEDTITARWCYKDFFTFIPTHKLLLVANHKPVIRGTDHAVWRRIKLIPFTATIQDSAKDTRLLARLRAERPGILAWAVRGCLEWQRDGLGEPKEVTDATAGYRQEQDVLARFLAEVCKVGKDFSIQSGALLERYQLWSGDKDMNPRTFAKAMESKGYVSEPGDRNRKYYKGIGIPG
jgi:putative DNA primase/helicase